MKVHFSAPLQDINSHIATYELIANTIKDSGHEFAKDWLEELRDQPKTSDQFSESEWGFIRKETLEAIYSADAVIIEASIASFSMGYISALALSHKKPLLMLFSSRPHPYILDASNSLKRIAVYNDDTELAQAVTNFLKDIDVDANNLRFNMVLDREIYNFLNWESVNTGKTKAQIIREVLKDRIKTKE